MLLIRIGTVLIQRWPGIVLWYWSTNKLRTFIITLGRGRVEDNFGIFIELQSSEWVVTSELRIDYIGGNEIFIALKYQTCKGIDKK